MNKIFLSGALLALLILSGCSNWGGCFDGYGPVLYETRDLDDFTAVSNSGSFEVRVEKSDTFGVEVQAQENLLEFIETYVSGSTLVIKAEDNFCFNSISPVIVYVYLPYCEEISNTGSGKLSSDRAEVVEFECFNSGSGMIAIDSIFASTVYLSNSGSGDLYVTASYPDQIQVVQSGSGMIDAGAAIGSLEVAINQTSSGKVYLDLPGGRDVETTLTGSGAIYLSGDANSADLGLSSSGKIDAGNLMVSDAQVLSSGSGKVYVYATDDLYVSISGSGDVYYRGSPSINSNISGSGSLRPY